jgi:hypothetical protein
MACGIKDYQSCLIESTGHGRDLVEIWKKVLIQKLADAA